MKTSFKRAFFHLILRQRPYHVEYTSSRPITEVKQRWARLVLGWVTAWEHRVLLAFFFTYLVFLARTNKSPLWGLFSTACVLFL